MRNTISKHREKDTDADYWAKQHPFPIKKRILRAPPVDFAIKLYTVLVCALMHRRDRRELMQSLKESPRRIWNKRRGTWQARRRQVINLPNALLMFWVLVVLWGERWVFENAVDGCKWESWETWPSDAQPHHLILLADPQLVDPHTYTGRPWPFSALTESHTDLYLSRSYKSLQRTLQPDTIYFLGDLFDGGREWATMRDDSSDPEWQMAQRTKAEAALVAEWKEDYGEDYWMAEYRRFTRLFMDGNFDLGNKDGNGRIGRKIIASLPGNHDLGFGAKIKKPVRDRFEAFFGEGNRVDIVGNHTFVSVDSVSLSAGADKSKLDKREIYAPVEDFLKDIKATKRRAVARELKGLRGEETVLQFPHQVDDALGLLTHDLARPTMDPGEDKAVDLPTILLTHVPLYRLPGTPCGPKREKYPPTTPPSGQAGPIIPDERNAIAVARGYQYQNVLSDVDSARLLDTIGNVKHVFSGDDHDYCEVVHDESNSGRGWENMVEKVKEITVKSMSYAMGVRHPGFEMVSLWNPVDGDGKALSRAESTIQTHLCLLPDQIGILLRYVTLIILSLAALLVRAVLTQTAGWPPSIPISASTTASSKDDPILPTTRKDHASDSSTSSTSSTKASLAQRSSATTKSRTSTPVGGYRLPAGGYGLPASTYSPPTPVWEEDKDAEKKVRWEEGASLKDGLAEVRDERGSTVARIRREFVRAVLRVAGVVVVFWMYLALRG